MTDNRLLRDVFGKRYGEVLLVHIEESGPMATVYCSFPLNDCPQELWDKLDAQAIAAENGAVAARLNGPRHWLMSSIEKVSAGAPVRKTFGGIEIHRRSSGISGLLTKTFDCHSPGSPVWRSPFPSSDIMR